MKNNQQRYQQSTLFTVRNKLLLIFLALSLIPMGILSTIVYRNASDALLNDAFASLEAVRTIKQQQIETFFEQLTVDARFIRELPAVVGTDDLGGLPALITLQNSKDDPAYQVAYQNIEGILQRFADNRQVYQDIMLVDLEGNVVYATLDESQDTNVLVTGEVKPEFVAASRNAVVIDDITFNVIHNEGNLKVGAPVINSSGLVIGSIILEIGQETINTIMTERTGLGETGETYLVGGDGLFRSESRFVDQLGVQTAVLNPQLIVNTTGSQSALANGIGTEIINDYRGTPVLSSWSPVVIQTPNSYHPNGLVWALLSEIDVAEVEQPATVISQLALTFGGIAALVVVIVAIFFTRSFTNQINAITAVFRRVEGGDLADRTPILNRDELGGVAAGLNSLLDQLSGLVTTTQIERNSIEDSIIKLLNEVSEVANGDLTIEAEVTADIAGAIADSFNYMLTQLRAIIINVQEATVQVGSSANEIQTTAEHLALGSESQASQIVDTSAAIDEMSVSIQQVSENALVSAQVAEKAQHTARDGARAVQNTIQGMDRIREQGQETAKRIKRLGES
jgi:methyl-accepting chemotaxis protein